MTKEKQLGAGEELIMLTLTFLSITGLFTLCCSTAVFIFKW
jgi:hypothetical protein